jgi:hypothetical protein
MPMDGTLAFIPGTNVPSTDVMLVCEALESRPQVTLTAYPCLGDPGIVSKFLAFFQGTDVVRLNKTTLAKAACRINISAVP